jgi:hypothetical protein
MNYLVNEREVTIQQKEAMVLDVCMKFAMKLHSCNLRKVKWYIPAYYRFILAFRLPLPSCESLPVLPAK